MPQELEPLCLIQFWSWMNPLFPLLALWGNKNWPSSMKVKKMQIFLNKMGWGGCQWSSLKAPGTQYPLCYPGFGVGIISFIPLIYIFWAKSAERTLSFIFPEPCFTPRFHVIFFQARDCCDFFSGRASPTSVTCKAARIAAMWLPWAVWPASSSWTTRGTSKRT